MRNRRQKRCIGFNQHSIFGNCYSNFLQVLGILECYNARNRNIEPEIERNLSKRRAGRETVNDACEGALPQFLRQDLSRVRFGVGGLENVAIVIEDEDPDDPDLFGLFEEAPYLPAKITIYRLPLVESFPDLAELEREIRITVLHELAHYFGIDEDRLDELGYG